MNATKLSILSLASVLAFFSFSVSFATLSELAYAHDVEPSQLFPLIIDGIIILALIWRLFGNDADMARLVLISYVALSVALNALSHAEIIGACMASVAPISLYVTSEICSSMLNMSTKIQKRDAKGRFVKREE